MSNVLKAFGSSLKAHTDNLKESAQKLSKEINASVVDTPTKDSRSPKDIPKDELIALCVKMSKKVKVLQSNRIEQEKRLESKDIQYQNLVSFIKEEVVPEVDLEPSPMAASANSGLDQPIHVDKLALIRKAWHLNDENRSMMLSELQKEFQADNVKHAEAIAKIKADYEEKLQLASMFTNGDSNYTSMSNMNNFDSPVQEREKGRVVELEKELSEMTSSNGKNNTKIIDLVGKLKSAILSNKSLKEGMSLKEREIV